MRKSQQRTIIGDTGRTKAAMKGRELARLLREHSITQAEAARRLGVSPSTVSRWIGGDYGLPPFVAETARAWRR